MSEPERWRKMDALLKERGYRIDVFWNTGAHGGPLFTARVFDAVGRLAPPIEEGDIWVAWRDTVATAMDALARTVLTGRRVSR